MTWKHSTRIVFSQTSKQYISSCKLILPHKKNYRYSAWELHDLNLSTAILHCLSKHSTECILLSKVRFFLDLATFWNPYRPLSWSNPFCTWKFFVFLWIRFPLCEHHITIWPNSPAKCRYRKKNHKFSKISRSLKLYSSWYSSWWWKYMQCWMNKTYCLSDTAQQLIKENAACWAEGKTANTAIFLSVAPTPQRGLCSFLSLYLCYISSKQCFEEMRLVKV